MLVHKVNCWCQAVLTLSLTALFMLAGSTSAPATYQSTQVTNNAYDDTCPQIDNNGYIAWSGYKCTDWEIFRWDPSGVVEQLTFNTTPDLTPDINDKGQVAYLEIDSSGQRDISVYDDGYMAITYDSLGEYYPKNSQLSNYYWGDYRTGAYNTYEISYCLNAGGASGSGSFSIPAAPDREPAVATLRDEYGFYDEVAYVGLDGSGQQQIVLFEVPKRHLPGYSGQIITNDLYPKNAVDINSNGDIVWDGLVDGDWEIFLYHNGQITQITDNDYNDSFPQINKDGVIVWEGYDGANSEIFVYNELELDSNNNPIRQITFDGEEDSRPRINDLGQIVYTKFDGNDWEVYLADNKSNYFSWDKFGGTFRDANKVDPSAKIYGESTLGDAYMCWAAAAADALAYGGWQVPNLDNEERILDYFKDHWENAGGYPEEGENWWIDGSEPILGADVEDPGGNFWTIVQDFDDYHDNEEFDGNLSALYSALTLGGTSVQISNGIISPHHSVAAWGVRFHTVNVSTESVIYPVRIYDGLWVTDSNDSPGGQSDQIPLPRHLIYLPVHNTSGNILSPDYHISQSFYNDYEDWWFDDVDNLRPAPPTYWCYDFTFQYGGGGDSYTGKVYADATRGYYVDQTWLVEDESGQAGQYTITSADRGDYGDMQGQVVIDTYFDSESGQDYHAGIWNGIIGGGDNYLGSESGYIIQQGAEEFHFGNEDGFVLEADLLQRFDFYFRYENGGGDYYNGVVYASQQENYKVGTPIYIHDEYGRLGFYDLYHMDYWEDPSQLGKVEINSYHDAESGDTFISGQNLTGGGNNFLTSEYGFIIEPLVQDYLFGTFMGKFYEADRVLRYYFMHYYENGDQYRGWVYAGPDKGYQVDKKINTWDEGDAPGYYIITGEGPLVNGCQAGQVFVQDYYDSEIGKRFTVNADSPLGTNYLTSEVGYIIEDGKPEYRFGGGADVTAIQEADGYYTYNTEYRLSDRQTFYGEGTVGPDFTMYFGTDKLTVPYNYYGLTGTLSREGNVALDIYAYLFNSGEIYWGVGVNDLGARTGYALLWPQSSPADGVLSWYAPTEGPTDDQFFAYNHLRAEDENFKLYSGTGMYDLIGGFQESLAEAPENIFKGAYFLADSNLGAYNSDIFYARNYWGLVHGLTLLEFEHSTYQDPPPITEGTWSFTYTKIDFNPVSLDDLASIQGDSYTGTVIASADKGYYPGYMEFTTDSNGQINGLYIITDATRVEDSTLAGQVFVDRYHDLQTNRDFSPVHVGNTVGLNYLGSEQDYIIRADIPEYRFGGSLEANLVTYAYDFTYTYGSGDSYQGTLYAAPELTYSQDYTLSVPADENDQPGSYVITGVWTADASGNSFDRSLDGQVFVDSYYNSENQQSYTPVGSDSPLGTGYFTSETGHIILDWVPEYAFGQGQDGQFCEADLVAYAYDYTFTFSNGDSYSGIVYAEPEKGYWSKDVGYSSFQSGNVEIGLTGEYTTDNMTPGFDVSLAGKVTVASYQDVEMKRTYVPTFTWGDNYLGSEYGYINLTDYPEKYHPANDFPPGINKFFFGNHAGMMYEADVKQDKKDKGETTSPAQLAMNVTEPFVSYQPYDEEKNKSQKVK